MDSKNIRALAGGYNGQIVSSPIIPPFDPPNKVQPIFSTNISQVNRIVVINDKMLIALNPTISISCIGPDKSPDCQFMGHKSNVTDIAISDKFILTCGEDKNICIWEKEFKNQIKDDSKMKPIATKYPLNTIAVADQQKRTFIFTGNEKGMIEIHSFTTNEKGMIEIHSFQTNEIQISEYPIRSIALSLPTLIAACHDGSVFIYDVDLSQDNSPKINKKICFKAHNDVILRVVIAPDKKTFVTTSADSTAIVWNLENLSDPKSCEMKYRMNPPNPKAWIWDAAYTSDSNYVILGGSDSVLRILNICNTLSQNWNLTETTLPHVKGITAIALYHSNKK